MKNFNGTPLEINQIQGVNFLGYELIDKENGIRYELVNEPWVSLAAAVKKNGNNEDIGLELKPGVTVKFAIFRETLTDAHKAFCASENIPENLIFKTPRDLFRFVSTKISSFNGASIEIFWDGSGDPPDKTINMNWFVGVGNARISFVTITSGGWIPFLQGTYIDFFLKCPVKCASGLTIIGSPAFSTYLNGAIKHDFVGTIFKSALTLSGGRFNISSLNIICDCYQMPTDTPPTQYLDHYILNIVDKAIVTYKSFHILFTPYDSWNYPDSPVGENYLFVNTGIVNIGRGSILQNEPVSNIYINAGAKNQADLEAMKSPTLNSPLITVQDLSYCVLKGPSKHDTGGGVFKFISLNSLNDQVGIVARGNSVIDLYSSFDAHNLAGMSNTRSEDNSSILSKS